MQHGRVVQHEFPNVANERTGESLAAAQNRKRADDRAVASQYGVAANGDAIGEMVSVVADEKDRGLVGAVSDEEGASVVVGRAFGFQHAAGELADSRSAL